MKKMGKVCNSLLDLLSSRDVTFARSLSIFILGLGSIETYQTIFLLLFNKRSFSRN